MQSLANFFSKCFDELIKIVENILKKPTLNILNPQKELVLKVAALGQEIISSEAIQTVENFLNKCNFSAVNWAGRNIDLEITVDSIYLPESQHYAFIHGEK